MVLKQSQPSDLPFLKQMLYEAVFWRMGTGRPTFEEAMAYPEVINALAQWGDREGDAAVVAYVGTEKVGAAWYRYWMDTDSTRGYVNESIPVLAIGVQKDYRHRGIGRSMIEWLVNYAAKHSIEKISLCVSKDNYAMNLYKQQGFTEHLDIGDSVTMIRDIKKSADDAD